MQLSLRYELRLKNHLIIAYCRIRRPGGLSSLRDIATNRTTCDILLAIDSKSAFYVENLKRLGGVVCRQRLELWPTVGYMELCVDTDLNCGRELVT
jgi:hypothetical protein